MRQRIFKMLISLLLLGSIVPVAPIPMINSIISAESSSEIANFTDPNLRQAITSWLGKSVTDTVYKSDIITKLPTSGYTFSANSKGISDLTGIEIFEGTGLTYLDLGRNKITELTALGNISSLKQLNIESNQVSDLNPIRNHTSIETLSVNSNQIMDISPLNSLTDLTSLDIANNKITDLTPVTELVKLVSLNFTANNISDIKPLTNLINLTSLSGTQNSISDLSPINRLLKLKTLYLASNNIVDITSLNTLTGITDLNIGSNSVASLSALTSMTGLTQLTFNANKVQDLTPLAGLSQLNNIQASQNLIHDLSPLAGLSSLSYLNLQYNPIVSITPLSGLTNLSSLNLGNTFLNPFSGEGQTVTNNITVLGTKKISPVVKYGVTSGSSLVHSIQIEAGKNVMPHYGFLQTSDGTNWSSSISWHQAFRDYYASTASTYSSSDSTIATVDSNGTITGIAPGKTQVTARMFGWASDYTEYTFGVVVEESPTPTVTPEASASPTPPPQPTSEPITKPLPVPTVTPPAEASNSLTAIRVTPSYSEIRVSETLQYKAEAIYADGSSQDITESAIWSLDNPAMADIDKGFLTGKKFGNAGVIATWGGKSGVADLLVMNLSVLNLTITPNNPTISLGQTQQFQAMAQYSNGTSVDVTNQAFWWVVYGEKASINSLGLAKGLTEGDTNIWAVWNNTSGFANLSVVVDIHPTSTPIPTIAQQPATSPTTIPKPSIEPTAITTPEPTQTPEPITTETPTITPSEEPQPVTEPITTQPTEIIIAPPMVIVTPTEGPTATPSKLVGGIEILIPEPIGNVEHSMTQEQTVVSVEVKATTSAESVPSSTPKPEQTLTVRVPKKISETEVGTVLTPDNNINTIIKPVNNKESTNKDVTVKHPTATSIPVVEIVDPADQQSVVAQDPRDLLSPYKKKFISGQVGLAIGIVSVLSSRFIWIIIWGRRRRKEDYED